MKQCYMIEFDSFGTTKKGRLILIYNLDFL